ncbi:nuclear pore complex NUP96 [Olea europaea subsp. europaea]|uniref:Nuclear pore complex NUP96 n=1 Tax=Olea europaea subsp. europaea TaxID=158383 RepID=A0A8S0VNT5_OLEEU|nr:nuclear pore complex NUP96 [Olea europaea subsp. europaea]
MTLYMLEKKDFFTMEIWNFKIASCTRDYGVRVAYTKMAEEICSLLLSDSSEGLSREAQLNCFDTMFRGPVPEDLRSCHLQDADMTALDEKQGPAHLSSHAELECEGLQPVWASLWVVMAVN